MTILTFGNGARFAWTRKNTLVDDIQIQLGIDNLPEADFIQFHAVLDGLGARTDVIRLNNYGGVSDYNYNMHWQTNGTISSAGSTGTNFIALLTHAAADIACISGVLYNPNLKNLSGSKYPCLTHSIVSPTSSAFGGTGTGALKKEETVNEFNILTNNASAYGRNSFLQLWGFKY